MKVLLKEPLCIGGVDYNKGTQEVPDSLESHWYFKASVVNGDISILEKGGKSAAPPEAPKAPEAPKPPAPNYHDQLNGKGPEAGGDKTPDANGDAPTSDAIIPKLDLKALQKQAKELGLKAGGKAAEIKARIDEHLSKGEAQAAQ